MTREEAIDIRSRSLCGEKVDIAELTEAMRVIAQPDRKPAKRPPPAIRNPWDLSTGMCQALSTLCRTGETVAAAQELGVNRATVDVQVSRAMDRMGTGTRLKTLLEWDRFERTRA
jgi:DNA-binding NarL/FixJ family response regulator